MAAIEAVPHTIVLMVINKVCGSVLSARLEP
jgi:hypothetical protein